MEQPKSPKVVRRKVETVLDVIRKSGYFEIFDLKEDYARKEITHTVLEEYAKQMSTNFEMTWGDKKIGEMLSRIFVGSILHELKEEGIVGTYEDENTEEVFFLTKKGKKYNSEYGDLIYKINNRQSN
jgi:hypothetical protein